MRRWEFAIFVIAVTGFVGYGFWRLYVSPFVALEKELQAIKSAGEPLRYEDIVPPILPSTDAAPIYKKTFQLFPKLTDKEWQALDEFRSGQEVDVNKVRRLLNRCRPALAMAKRASQLPYARWIKWKPNPFDIQVRHLSDLRSIARLLAADALLHLQDGDVEVSLENTATLMRMAHQLSDEPLELHLYTASALFQFAVSIIQAVAERSVKVSPKRLEQLRDIANRLDGDQLLLRCLQLKRVMIIAHFNWLRANPKEARQLARIWSKGCCLYDSNLAAWAQPLSRQLAINQLLLMRYHRKLIAIARKGEPYDWRQFELLDKWGERVRTFGFTIGDFAFRPLAMAGEFMYPGGLRSEGSVSGSAFRVVAKAKANQRIFLTALALHLFWQEQGRYPTSLSELTPRYLPAVPKDPFDGKPLRYRQEKGGFRIWSIGEDLKDDGGVKRADLGKFDIVLRVSRETGSLK